MFNCESCGKSSGAYEKPELVTVVTRKREYKVWDDRLGVERLFTGFEIVRELRVHAKCAAGARDRWDRQKCSIQTTKRTARPFGFKARKIKVLVTKPIKRKPAVQVVANAGSVN